jgi:Phosphotransferase enzyme family
VRQTRRLGCPRQTVQVDGSLPGGVANAGEVIRQGDSVLRPSNPNSTSIHKFLTALRGTGFEGASLPVEIQSDGRERLKFIEGDVPIPPYPEWAQSNDALASVALLLLEFHRASALVAAYLQTWSDELADASGGPIVCHNDVCMENVVFRNGVAVGLLDFDFAAPGRPLYDLAQFARMCVPIDDDMSAERLGWNITDNPARLRLVTDAYGLAAEVRQDLIECLDRSMNRGEDFVRRRVAAGDPNFIRMLEEMGGIERYERRRAWWESRRGEFVAALV